MKVAIVYNRESQRVINLFGVPNREKIGMGTIQKITNALRKGGHQVRAIEGDKDLITKLEDYMPRVLKGERPGIVFNVSYGIQGQARYTHVPSILEMVGIPYVGSGPLAHSLALDKVVAKMIFRQHGLPTPDFAVLTTPEDTLPELRWPLIVKPKNEAVSFGIQVVHDEPSLREAAKRIFDKYEQPVLVEQYIEGQEVNVGILGNQPPEPLPPALLRFGEGPQIYTYEDKTRRSGREIEVVCPAPLDPALLERAQEIAVGAFSALGCYDCARVDMRLDADGNLYILEVNSLPSLGEHGSYLAAAAAAGLDFDAVINRLVEVASARYFGSAVPLLASPGKPTPGNEVFDYLTTKRDRIEKRLEEWCRVPSRTGDPVGVRAAVRELDRRLRDIGLRPSESAGDARSTWLWETAAGYEGGTLLILHVDVPMPLDQPVQAFRRDPEFLYGEGVGSSRAPIVAMEFALRALREARTLRKRKIGVLVYSDELRDCRYSGDQIRQASEAAARVLVLRAGNVGNRAVKQRRGQRKYKFVLEGRPRRPGNRGKNRDLLTRLAERLAGLAAIDSARDRASVAVSELRTEAFPMLLPHRVQGTLLMTYLDPAKTETMEQRVREVLLGKEGRAEMVLFSERPPMRERRSQSPIVSKLKEIASRWEIPFEVESSVWPSAAGLVASAPVLCGMGPVAENLNTPHERVHRISLPQRTLLLAEFLNEVE